MNTVHSQQYSIIILIFHDKYVGFFILMLHDVRKQFGKKTNPHFFIILTLFSD